MRIFARLASIATVSALLVFAHDASATPVFYSNLGAYATATAGMSNDQESLNSGSLFGSLPKTTPKGVTISTNNNGSIDTAVYGNLQSLQFDTATGGTTITFDFASGINAFAINVYDLGTSGPTNLTLTTPTGSQILYNNFTGTTGNLLYAGVIDTATKFTHVQISNSQSGDFVELDAIRFGVVPEPSSIALLGLGLLGLGWRRRSA